MTIGKRLRIIRQNQNITIKMVVDKCHMSRNTIYKHEHDMLLPREGSLRKYCDMYNVTMAQLLQGVQDSGLIAE